MKVFCTECHQEKDEKEFYKRFITDEGQQVMNQGVVIATLHNTKGICKECLLKKVINVFKSNKGDYAKTINDICKEYNLPFVKNILWKLHGNESENNIKEIFVGYIKDITSLPQYKNKTYCEEKSDIDFINDDIKQLKKNIEKAIQNEDFNAHNKWMNCLRDAIELREKLQGVKENIINIGTIMVKDEVDINNLTEELTKMTKRQINSI